MKNKLVKILKKNRIVLVAHIYATGPALELEEFLKLKVRSLLFIGHPFSFKKDNRSFLNYYKNGHKVISFKTFPLTLPVFFLFVKEAFLTIYWTIKFAYKSDTFIGSDNFSAYIGLILKRFGVVKKVILYTIDFVPIRFENPFLNWLYHYFDRQCLKNCSIVWNVSDQITKAREKYKVVLEGKSAIQITVPLGVWYDRIPKLNYSQKQKNTLVFMGHLLDKQGLQIVIEALKDISVKIPDIKLVVVGTGPFEKDLKKIAKINKVDKYVEFNGYIESHEEVERILSKASLGLATYKPDPSSFTYFADPGKIKNYLAAGLPLIVTDVPQIAKVIDKKRCGVLTEYSKNEVARNIITLLLNKNLLIEYSDNARKFARNYDWNKVFSDALTKSF